MLLDFFQFDKRGENSFSFLIYLLHKIYARRLVLLFFLGGGHICKGKHEFTTLDLSYLSKFKIKKCEVEVVFPKLSARYKRNNSY